ncbi:MAG TPA: TIGR03915 family putative DNA repair protein [Syntrophomonadaceae bacterium]|nr:TIGR03915 family putative DNA repair protein [Syntrophomonadaceae bacterium]
MDYLYDSTFDGLLTCIYHNYYHEIADGIYPQKFHQPSLISKSSLVISNSDHAARVYKAIEEKISAASLVLVYRAFLSSCPGKENIILNYLRLGFRMGSKIDFFHSHPHVHPLHKIARQVTREVHRILGLLRFADNGKFLYASLSPDHDILPLIADHFAERMAAERWLIHDQKRSLAIIYDGPNTHEKQPYPRRQWCLITFDQMLESSMPEEDRYRELWKLYFARISIDSRRNPRLQSQFIPQRYRQHLVEFDPSFHDE